MEFAVKVLVLTPYFAMIMLSFNQNIRYRVQTNNLKLTKNNQNNMIKIPQTRNIALQAIEKRL